MIISSKPSKRRGNVGGSNQGSPSGIRGIGNSPKEAKKTILVVDTSLDSHRKNYSSLNR